MHITHTALQHHHSPAQSPTLCCYPHSVSVSFKVPFNEHDGICSELLKVVAGDQHCEAERGKQVAGSCVELVLVLYPVQAECVQESRQAFHD